ncbi:MAG: serine--tRNA ligase, partial [Deltaproteobacteria bacterium]
MLDGKFIKQNPDEVKKAIANRGEDPAVIDRFLEYEAERKELLSETESLRHKRNVVSAQVARMKQKGENADELIAAMREVSSKIKELNDSLSEIQARMDSVLLGIPNTPHESVPTGTDESDNPTLRKHGTIPDFDFQPRAHWEIGESLGILDFKRAAKIAGARFPLYVGAGALMERALINFMLDIHTVEHGYTECLPPFMVNEKTM